MVRVLWGKNGLVDDSCLQSALWWQYQEPISLVPDTARGPAVTCSVRKTGILEDFLALTGPLVAEAGTNARYVVIIHYSTCAMF